MNRSKTLLLTLALIAGLGLATGCNKKVNNDEKASAESAKKEDKKDESSDQKKDEDKAGELPFEATGTVAIVNGDEISAEKFNEQVKRRAGMLGGRQMPPRLAQMMKKRTLDRLIDEHLIDKQLADAKAEVSAKDVDEHFKEFKDRFPSEDAFKAFLTRNGTTIEEMKKNFKKDLQLRQILEKKYGIDVSEADAKKYYEDHPKRFEQKEQVHARHILIKTDKDADQAALDKAKKRAEEIAKQAKKPGTDFAKLAKEKSEGPSASRGGDLGFFTRKRMVPEFSKAAFDMKPGEITGPIKTQFGYHIIKVEEKKEAGKVPFAEAKEKILNQLKRQKFRKSMKQYLAELKKDAKIERKEDNIKVNVKAPAKGSAKPQLGGGGMPNMQLKKQIQQKIRQAQQQKAKGSDDKKGSPSEDPTNLKLQQPKLGK